MRRCSATLLCMRRQPWGVAQQGLLYSSSSSTNSSSQRRRQGGLALGAPCHPRSSRWGRRRAPRSRSRWEPGMHCDFKPHFGAAVCWSVYWMCSSLLALPSCSRTQPGPLTDYFDTNPASLGLLPVGLCAAQRPAWGVRRQAIPTWWVLPWPLLFLAPLCCLAVCLRGQVEPHGVGPFFLLPPARVAVPLLLCPPPWQLVRRCRRRCCFTLPIKPCG